MNILVVEDESIVALALSGMISAAGHRVTSRVASAAAAFESVERDRPDLVLMDIRIEGPLDGIDAALVLRERWGLPVAFTSAFADAATRGRAEKAEPLAFLPKPIVPARMRGFLAEFAASPPPA